MMNKLVFVSIVTGILSFATNGAYAQDNGSHNIKSWGYEIPSPTDVYNSDPVGGNLNTKLMHLVGCIKSDCNNATPSALWREKLQWECWRAGAERAKSQGGTQEGHARWCRSKCYANVVADDLPRVTLFPGMVVPANVPTELYQPSFPRGRLLTPALGRNGFLSNCHWAINILKDDYLKRISFWTQFHDDVKVAKLYTWYQWKIENATDINDETAPQTKSISITTGHSEEKGNKSSFARTLSATVSGGAGGFSASVTASMGLTNEQSHSITQSSEQTKTTKVTIPACSVSQTWQLVMGLGFEDWTGLGKRNVKTGVTVTKSKPISKNECG